MYVGRGKRRHLHRRLRGCYRILHNDRQQRDGFWDSLNEYCVPCVEVCRTLTPNIRLSHLKVLLLLPSLFCLTFLYMKTETDTRYQMIADVDRPSWDPDRLLGRLLQWELLQRARYSGVSPTPPRVLSPDCQALFSGNPLEIQVTREMMYTETRSSSTGRTSVSCEQLYDNRTNSQNRERDRSSSLQPLAYVVQVKHHHVQLVKLLRAIHTANNTYCLYLQDPTDTALYEATEQLAKCFTNVLVTPPGVYHTDLDAQFWCIRKLILQKTPRWQHLIHLTDQHFPLATNLVISRTLSRFPNCSDVPAVLLGSMRQLSRTMFRGDMLKSALLLNHTSHNVSHQLEVPQELQDLTIYRGDYCFVAHRTFIINTINDIIAKKLRTWTTMVFELPSLVFWPTQFAQSAARTGRGFGSVLAVSKQSLFDTDYTQRCVSENEPVCVFTVDDLSWLAERKQLFAGRFDMDVDHVVLYCLAKRRQAMLNSQLVSSTHIPHGAPAYHKLNKHD